MDKKRLQYLAGIKVEENEPRQLNEMESSSKDSKALYALADQLKDAARFMEEGNKQQGMDIVNRVSKQLLDWKVVKQQAEK